jgi:hypothetical protein
MVMLYEDGGFYVVGWDLEWFADRGMPEDHLVVYNKIRRLISSPDSQSHLFTPGHIVLLCHDQNYSSAASMAQLRAFIELVMKDEDIELASIDKYPGLQNLEMAQRP